tara:strand:+ start:585 stop:899 length:315 start_codon:yes stop_codon:yes gene_type:complete
MAFKGTNAATAWCNFNQSSIREDFGVSSVTDNGTGNYTVNFSTSMGDSNYCALVTSGNQTNAPAGTAFGNVYSATSCKILITGLYQAINRLSDASLTCAAFFQG